MKSVEEIVEIAYKRALPKLIEISEARLKHKRRVANRNKLKRKVRK